MPRSSKKGMSAKRKRMLIYIGMGIVIIGLLAWIVYPMAQQYYEGEEPTVLTASTVKLIASNPDDHEDVSNFVPVSIYTVDPDKDFDPTEDDNIRPDALLDYFERKVNNDDADDVSIDLRDETYFWIVIDPSDETVFETDYYLGYGGYNRVITLEVHHLSSNVYFENNLLTDGTRGVPTANGNYTTTVTGYPLHDSAWANYHVGTGWALSESDYDDLSASAKSDYLNEDLWCVQAGTYDPTVDTDKDYEDDLELYTEVFAFKITMNDTIGADASVTDVNVTMNTKNVEVLISGANIYFAVLEDVVPTWSLDYEIWMGANITASAMYSGRLTVPDDDTSGLSYSAYSYSLS